MTESLSRTSALAERHWALGSALEDWNGMGTAWSYLTDPDDEHDAVREAAGMFDMSGLKKVYVRGGGAAAAADYLFTRDMTKVAPGQSAYGAVLTERGTVGDDAILYNLGGGEWLAVHGSGETMERLEEFSGGKDVDAELNDDLHDISLQGPVALNFLNQHTPLDLHSLRYFHHARTELFGYPCLLSRTGYSGERGYEIFAAADATVNIWDNIAGMGGKSGIMPCSFAALDKARVEAALPFYGYDMTAEHSPWEVGLGWSVSRNKGDFCGKEAAFKSEGRERFKMVGLEIAAEEALAGGELLVVNDEKVGEVNSPVWSRRMQKSLALGHARPDLTSPGAKLTAVAEDGREYAATVAATPFYDPHKTKTHA